jgi:hypothetical protein
MKKFLGKSLSVVAMFAMVFNVALATPQPNITICHYPPGNPNNQQTLTINANSWPALEALGATMGPCDGDEILSCDPQFNLIANGGFEMPLAPNNGWAVFDDGHPDLGWNVSWNGTFDGAPDVAKLELHRGVNGWASYEGNQHAELDSDWGHASNEQASVSINQNISTIPGNTYTISYAFSPRPNTGANQNVLEVLVNGSLVQTQGPTANNTNQTIWTPHTFDFVATGSVTNIAFRDAGIPDTFGTFLDDVSVVCVDEPEVCEGLGELYARINIPDNATKWRSWGTGNIGTAGVKNNPIVPKMFVGGDNSAHHTDGGNVYNAFEWFPLTENGAFINDADIASYRDVPGLAVQRMNGKIRVVLYGFHESEAVGKELASGSIELSTDMSTRLTNAWTKGNGFSSPEVIGYNGLNPVHENNRIHDASVNDSENPMDGRGSFKGNINQYNPRFDNVRVFSNLFQFHLVATTGSDGFYAQYDFEDMVEVPCLN